MRFQLGLFRILILALLCVVGFCLYRGLSAGLAAYHFSEARQELGAGNIGTGVELLQRARSFDGSHGRSTFLLARHAAVTGDLRQAETLLRRLRDSGDRSVDTLATLGRLYLDGGKPSEAREQFEILASLHPQHVAGPLGLAQLPQPDRNPLAALLDREGIPLPQDSRGPGTVQGVALLHLGDELGANGYGTPAAAQSLLEARKVGVNSVSVRVPGRQDSVAHPRVQFGVEGPSGERDDVVLRTIRDAHRLGLRVLLKPHVMLTKITPEEWRGTIAYANPEKQEEWWSSYRGFILHYARLAQREGVEIFCVGVELRDLVKKSPERWRQLIREVRTVYAGELTYAANWYYEFEEVSFWADLDLIGLQFFFPLSESTNPSLEELTEAMTPILSTLNEIALGFGKPILLTEVGYKSTPGATREPWLWPKEGLAVDLAIQERAYDAIFTSFRDIPWFAGMFWWNWLTEPEPGPKFRPDFTPQGKPAMTVMKREWQTKD